MNILGFTVEITNPMGFFSLISIIILLLSYFLKPKPFRKVIPSLIFLETQKKKQTFTGFLSRFIKDWLFLIQLIVLLMLCLSTLGLFTYMKITVNNNEVVCVIDASASSSVKEDGTIRFAKGISTCMDNLGVKNSIIEIKDSPLIIAKQTDQVNAKRILRSLKPTQSLSSIWDAMLVASDVAYSKQAKIVVTSDFIDTYGKDVNVAKDILLSKGFDVSMVDTGSAKNNIGIINYQLYEDKVTLDIKNYNNYASTIKIKNNGHEVNLDPNSISSTDVLFNKGINKIELDIEDDFTFDNTIYINIPDVQKTKVLIISNSRNTDRYR
jgi:hypothetical protein